ncbi:RNA-binding domain-containing protein [Bifidobacterium felsineum]|uniref:AAA family ATPase n=1 Tax=Bifidobacterium felsineum TaxID=2045440 RepID=A0A2M9HI15_9BIFI|nr:RNA-binding domain-containing protein [Bifidobacterium felsineum]PJM76452.1 AAA family ATPase [Bifidobacterium felsineum]
MNTFDVAKIASYRENNRLEAKAARGGLPRSMWETYSAFANTYGGVILLGVAEREDKTFEPAGLNQSEAEHLRQDFWNTVSNRSKVSAVLPIESEVELLESDGGVILAIHVPRAPREERPVYINNDLYNGTYRRRGEGDYRCSRQEIVSMVRDQTPDGVDGKVLDEFSASDLNAESIRAYRMRFQTAHAQSAWNTLAVEPFLRAVGAAAVSREDGRLHPTLAGMLMFGNDYDILRECPNYFLDYREALDTSVRWTDRVHSGDGLWSGNVFDFFFQVSRKLTSVLKVPFALDGIFRVDDTLMHKAVREALANCLFNADYYGVRGVVVRCEPTRLVFENPGDIRTGVEQMRLGGVSDPRNAGVMRMFSLIDVGERAGTGVPDVFNTWAKAGLPEPQIEECFGDAERTILSLMLERQQISNTQADDGIVSDIDNKSDNIDNKSDNNVSEAEARGLGDSERDVLRYVATHPNATQEEIGAAVGIGRTAVANHTSSLQKRGLLKRIGSRKTGHWEVLVGDQQ